MFPTHTTLSAPSQPLAKLAGRAVQQGRLTSHVKTALGTRARSKWGLASAYQETRRVRFSEYEYVPVPGDRRSEKRERKRKPDFGKPATSHLPHLPNHLVLLALLVVVVVVLALALGYWLVARGGERDPHCVGVKCAC